MNFIVSIIGRPNVGKSTLFNRLIGKYRSIVHSKSGVTRDSVFGYSNWNGKKFIVIDTGGFTVSNNSLNKEINYRIFKSIKISDIILFIIDAESGFLKLDYKINDEIIVKYKTRTLLVINKIDKLKNFNIYNVDDILGNSYLEYDKYYISSINGSGTGDLLDKIVHLMEKKNKNKIEKEESHKLPKFSIIGRPNVGKSTLINSFMNERKHIVSHISGTTRDRLYVTYLKLGYKCIIIDTPGIRKKSKVKEYIEIYSVNHAIKTITKKNVDMCFLMIDAIIGWDKQEMSLFKLIEKYQKKLIILVNKWDMIMDNRKDDVLSIKKNYEAFIRNKIYPFYNVPILFISSEKKYGIKNIIPLAFKIMNYSKKKLKTSILNKTMLPILKKNPPPSIRKNKKRKIIKIKYCCIKSCSSLTPKFIFFSNFPQYIKESYRKFIERKIRYFFNFKGIPIKISFEKK